MKKPTAQAASAVPAASPSDESKAQVENQTTAGPADEPVAGLVCQWSMAMRPGSTWRRAAICGRRTAPSRRSVPPRRRIFALCAHHRQSCANWPAGPVAISHHHGRFGSDRHLLAGCRSITCCASAAWRSWWLIRAIPRRCAKRATSPMQEWLQYLHGVGLLKASFVPPAEILGDARSVAASR